MRINLSGRLLVASPYLSDGNFLRSVVFIVKHDIEGAFGLSINRPSERRFRDLIDMHESEGQPRDDDWIYVGGPVTGPLLALHRLAGVGEPCAPLDPNAPDDFIGPDASNSHGVKHTVHNHPSDPYGSMSIDLGNPPAWITGDEDHLRILLRRSDTAVRFVADYSGWGPNQLDQEMQVGGWLVCDADEDLLFGDPDTIWESAVRRCGHEILNTMSPGMRFGDPNLN